MATSSTKAATSSPFFNYTEHTHDKDLALLYLRRDNQIPVILTKEDDKNEGYSEGKVTNTRFGSFPHSTLINVKWGSQIRASNVDTGSRGRKAKADKKRKRDDADEQDAEGIKAPMNAESGFVHLVPPTPENWTISLPHRTQVVYTHDSGYILQRLRVRPGSVIIEAGAGSGSFSHAAARAVYGRGGKVLSFEFHEPRYHRLAEELHEHGLDDVIELRHRDVCEDGFGGSNLKASAVFLDLPAPWLAFKHLTRDGPLRSDTAIRICTFSPCIEQVQRTVTEMMDRGWVDIETVEIAAKRMDVRRDRVGLQEEGLKGVNSNAASVDEAVSRLSAIQKKIIAADGEDVIPTKSERLAKIQEAQADRRLHMEGTISHRPELDLKLHTSFLTTALLPLAWTEEDEAQAQSLAQVLAVPAKEKSKRQQKKELGSKPKEVSEGLSGIPSDKQQVEIKQS